MLKKIFSALLLSTALLAIFFLPLFTLQRTISRGTDKYAAHHPVIAEQTVTQKLETYGPVSKIGLILGKLRRESSPPDLNVDIYDANNNHVSSHVIPPDSIIDDHFVWIDVAINKSNFTINISAPEATSQNALGVRFEEDNPGQIALAVVERAPLWRAVAYQFQSSPNGPIALTSLLLAVALAILLTLLTRNDEARGEKATLASQENQKVRSANKRVAWPGVPRRAPAALSLASDRAKPSGGGAGHDRTRNQLISFFDFLKSPLQNILTWRLPVTAKINHYLLISFFILIIAASFLLIHHSLLSRLYGVSGGDAYNYLSITKAIAKLENPFTADKRLPVWPILQLPAFLSNIDDTWYMRFLSGLSAAGILFTLPFLARRLRLPWAVAITAPIILGYQRDFLLTSLRPEAYTFYALLVILSLLLFTYMKNNRAQIALGVVLGLAAMTRQEGFVLAVVIGLCSFAYWKQLWWRGFARLIIPGLIIVLPFFINNAVEFGNPLYTPYFEGGRNEIVNSWSEFREAAGATWGIIGTLWRPLWESQTRIPLTDPILLTGAALVLLFTLLKPLAHSLSHSIYYITTRLRTAHEAAATGRLSQPSRKVRKEIHSALAPKGLSGVSSDRTQHGWISRPVVAAFLILSSLTALIFFTYSLLNLPSVEYGNLIIKLLSGALLAGIIPFLYLTRWRGLPLILVLITQILIALWFHPFPKHYQQDYALLSLILSTALLSPLTLYFHKDERRHLGRAVAAGRQRQQSAEGQPEIRPAFARRAIAGLAPAARALLSWRSAATAVPIASRLLFISSILFIFLSSFLLRSQKTTAMLDESNQNTAPDNVIYDAIQTARTLPGPHGFDRYYQPAALYFGGSAFTYSGEPGDASFKQWLSKHNIKTYVTTNTSRDLITPPDNWQEIAEYLAEGKNEKRYIGRVYIQDK